MMLMRSNKSDRKSSASALSQTFFLALLCLIFGAGCVHTPVQSRGVQPFDSEAPLVSLKEVDSFRVTDPDAPKVVDEELEQIPVEINPMVEKWVAYFQGKGRPHMERYLARSTRYSKLMKKILKQNGLPEDLIYIALIESGFSYKATSRAAAVGYWQFIRPTGRRYGLEINALIDERRDPVLATQAAAEYFKGLYSVFGSWYLAMASYNVGENRVKKEVMNHYTRDFWELARKRRFPRETINYIPKFIAAKLIGNDPAKYGFTDVEYMTPIEFEHIVVDKAVNLRSMAAKMDVDYDDLKQLNPKFKGEVAPLKGNSLELRVPIGQTGPAAIAARQSFVDRVEFVADAGDTKIHRVRSGESLYVIARRYRTTVAWLRDVNDLKKGRKLRIGQRLAVPERSGSKSSAVRSVAKTKKEDSEKASANPEVVTSKGVFYVVQPGDTLSAIADDYNSSVEELRRMNKLSRRSILRAGLKLKVPKDDGLPSEPVGVAKADASRTPQSVKSSHVVRAGENLTLIAHRYGVSINDLRRANNLSKRSILKIGARLKIPANGRGPGAGVSGSQSRIEKRRKTARRYHVVKRGENLSVIADRYRVSLSSLKAGNGMRGSKILVGAKILIPVASARE